MDVANVYRVQATRVVRISALLNVACTDNGSFPDISTLMIAVHPDSNPPAGVNYGMDHPRNSDPASPLPSGAMTIRKAFLVTPKKWQESPGRCVVVKLANYRIRQSIVREPGSRAWLCPCISTRPSAPVFSRQKRLWLEPTARHFRR